MRTATVALAGLVLAGLAWTAPAGAQEVPRGSYLRSCTDVRMEGDTLVARCRRADGRGDRTSLAEVRRCVGDISNNNGNLQCNYGGGPPRGPAPYPDQRYGGDFRERCGGLHREAETLRDRIRDTYEPYERARLEGRLREVREQEERCR